MKNIAWQIELVCDCLQEKNVYPIDAWQSCSFSSLFMWSDFFFFSLFFLKKNKKPTSFVLIVHRLIQAFFYKTMSKERSERKKKSILGI